MDDLIQPWASPCEGGLYGTPFTWLIILPKS